MNVPVLQTRGLTKRFGHFLATDCVDLDVRANEIHALIGPNGAGKTTLIKQLTGELRQDQGRVILSGRDVSDISIDRRALAGLGRSFQVTSVLTEFTALQNVKLALKAGRTGRFNFWSRFEDERCLDDEAYAALSKVGLGAKARTSVDSFGYGERRQLEIAIVLAMRPKIFLLDEPLAGMSTAESSGIVQLIADLRTIAPILLVEHDMKAVFSLADRITVLSYGKKLATGTPDDIRRNEEVRSSYLGGREA